MANLLNNGEIIKILREKRNMTRNQLTRNEMLCTIRHLARIEAGSTNPSIFLLNALYEHLGEDPAKYRYTFANHNNEDNYNKIREIMDLISIRKFEEVKVKTKALMESESFDRNDKFNNQLVLFFQALVISRLEQKYEEALILLDKAINITIKVTSNDYIRAINENVLLHDEVRLFNSLALEFYSLKNNDMAIDILKNLKNNMDRSFIGGQSQANMYALVLFNLSNYLGLNGRYQEAIDICDTGIKHCQNNKMLNFIGEFYYNKGFGLHCLENIYESEKFFKMSLVLLEAAQNFSKLETAKISLKEIFNMNI